MCIYINVHICIHIGMETERVWVENKFSVLLHESVQAVVCVYAYMYINRLENQFSILLHVLVQMCVYMHIWICVYTEGIREGVCTGREQVLCPAPHITVA